MVAGAVSVWQTSGSLWVHLGVTTALIVAAVFMFWVLYSTDYRLTDEKLRVHSGPFSWTIDLDSIEELFPTHNPLSSLACSLDRLRIRYRGADFGIMTSPQDKARFLQELATRTPQLEIEGSRLVRRSEQSLTSS